MTDGFTETFNINKGLELNADLNTNVSLTDIPDGKIILHFIDLTILKNLPDNQEVKSGT